MRPNFVSTQRALMALLALSLVSCRDVFYPAAAPVVPLRLQVVANGIADPLFNTGVNATRAFDKTDAARLRVATTEKALFDGRVALAVEGTDRAATLEVELPSTNATSVRVDVWLLRGSDTLFTGTTSATLTPGQPSTLNVALSGQARQLEVGGPFVVRQLGGTIPLVPALLFATGDTLLSGSGVSATFRSLDPTIATVSTGGLVSTVTNGVARVEASVGTLRDTAQITITDKCQVPFITALAMGSTTNGAFDAADCYDAANLSYNDWYAVSLSGTTLFRATMKTDGFEPFVGMTRATADRPDIGVAAATVPTLVSEYLLPAGSYLLRTGSRARPSGAAPLGSYSLSLAELTGEPQSGCFDGATWMLVGTAARGRLAADDCAVGTTTRRDLYGVRAQPRDTVALTAEAPAGTRLQINDDMRTMPASGNMTVLVAGDAARSHYATLMTGGTGPFAAYTLRAASGVPDGYSACQLPPIFTTVGTVGAPFVRTGQLQPRVDCAASGGTLGPTLTKQYDAAWTSVPFQVSVNSTTIGQMGIGMQFPGGGGWIRWPSTLPATAEMLIPPGQAHRLNVAGATRAMTGGSGTFTMSATTVTAPQNGCLGVITMLDMGSSGSGQLQPNDCLDDVGKVRRVDSYFLLLFPGDSATVTVSAQFPVFATRWVNATFVESRRTTVAGQSVSLSFRWPRDSTTGAFHYLYVLEDQPGIMGAYTITASGRRASAATALRDDAVRPMQLLNAPVRGGSPP